MSKQQYNEKHHLRSLLEELMEKVLRDQPDDPIVYLIKRLYRKADLPIPKSLLQGTLKRRSHERPEIQELFQKILRNSKDPGRRTVENILLVGLPGAGKSALLCTLNAALTGRYTPWMRHGRGVAQTNTLELKRFERCGIREFDFEEHRNRRILTQLLPTLPHFWDFAGLGDDDSAALSEILDLIINGYIPPGTNYTSLEKLQKEYGFDEDILRMKYDEQHPEWKITTVVFVHSCRVNVPKNLINCLLSVLNRTDPDSGRTTYTGDVFVVMTKQDLADKPNTDSDGEECKYRGSSNRQVPFVDTSHPEADVSSVVRQLAAEFNMQGSLAFTSTKLTNYSDDTGYDYNPEIVMQHLKFLYLITLPKHRTEETPTPSKKKTYMKFKFWMRRIKRLISRLFVWICIPLFLAIIFWYIFSAATRPLQPEYSYATRRSRNY